jgi:Ca2+-binding EF-hand superfamily protein
MATFTIPDDIKSSFTEAEQNKLKEDFKGFDLDSNGEISEDELKQIFSKGTTDIFYIAFHHMESQGQCVTSILVSNSILYLSSISYKIYFPNFQFSFIFMTTTKKAGVTLTPHQFQEIFEQVDIDKSGTLSFPEYCVMMFKSKKGKRGSQLSDVFTKAADMLRVQGTGGATHSFSVEERNAFTNHINSCLSHDPIVKERYLPLRPESSDLFERLTDGVIYCKLINLVVEDTVDERTINLKGKKYKIKISCLIYILHN